MSETQLCWSCERACGKCEWSKDFKPVKGWKAEKIPYMTGKWYNHSDYTYSISECPKYVPDKPRKEIKPYGD